MTIRHERVKFPPRGMLGGKPGSAGRDLVNGKPVPAKIRMDLLPGDVVTFDTPGGGGMGPPGERPATLVQTDLRDGLVSDYAVAVDYAPLADKVHSHG
jgi:N-methylhydantoinase B